MATMQDILDLARLPLNDPSKVAYPDADLLKYANSGLRFALERRPDLRIGTSLGWGAFADLSAGSSFPLGDEKKQTLADYVAGRAEMGDDEHVNSTRAEQLLQLFLSEL